ncbi:hypothetical protein JAAARDRAFT_115987, partial [Jaapia argillacea MUCL 33604]
EFEGRVLVYHSAVAQFYAASDICGAGGMYQECICSNLNWHSEDACYATEVNANMCGMWGMVVGCVKLFFLFLSGGKKYPCALIKWLVLVDNAPDEVTGMWVVKP